MKIIGNNKITGSVKFSAFSPLELSPALHLDPSDVSTITLNGTNISQIDDKSGHGLHAIEPILSRQPPFVESGIGGLGTMRFTGGRSLYIGDTISTLLQMTNWTILAIIQRTTGTGKQRFITKGYDYADTPENVNIGWTINQTHGGGTGDYNTGFELADGTDENITSGVPASTLACVTSRKSSSLLELLVNGVQKATKDVTGLTPALSESKIGIGAGYVAGFDTPAQHMVGDIGEIVIYDKALSDIEKKVVEFYLINKWGI